jgi:WD40 repeat protein
LVLSKDGKILVSGSLDSTIIVWNTETGEKVGDPLMLHSSAVNCVCISPDGKYIASGSED